MNNVWLPFCCFFSASWCYDSDKCADSVHAHTVQQRGNKLNADTLYKLHVGVIVQHKTVKGKSCDRIDGDGDVCFYDGKLSPVWKINDFF